MRPSNPMDGARTIELPLGRIEVDESRKLVRFTRSDHEITGATELGDALALFEAALRDVPRGGWVLLFDLRRSTGPRDPAWEATVVGPGRARLMRDFRAVAMLVGSAGAALQMHRVLRAEIEAGRARVFREERDAWSWLLGPGATPPR